MATGVSLINKDILRYFQTQNLLAPPEAIELTNLYNEMSELMKKPVKYRDQAVQMNLFYDLLSQYGKHLQNLKLASSEDIPAVPTPSLPSTSSELPTTPISSKKRKQSSSKPAEKQTPEKKIPINDDDEVFDMSGLQISDSPDDAVEAFAKKMGIDETPKLVLKALKENDSTFQIFPDAHKIIVHGRQLDGPYFADILKKLQNPQYQLKPKANVADPLHNITVQKIMSVVQTTDEQMRKRILKKLPGLQNAIAVQSRSQRKPLHSDPTPSAYVSPISSTTTGPPHKLKLGGKGKLKKSRYAVVNWKRWQRHLQTL